MAIVLRPPGGWRPASPKRETITILGEFLTLIYQNLYLIEKSISNRKAYTKYLYLIEKSIRKVYI